MMNLLEFAAFFLSATMKSNSFHFGELILSQASYMLKSRLHGHMLTISLGE